MRSTWVRLLQVAILLLAAGGAQAATFACSLGIAPNYTQIYSAVSNSSTALSVTVTCTKTGGGGGITINYTVTPNNGLNPSGSQNRATGAAGNINYDLYTDSSCTIPWSGGGTMTFAGGKGGASISQTLNYFGCVPATQPVFPSAGSSTDIVSMTLATSTGGVAITGTNPQSFNVTINVNPTCTFSTSPGTVNFGTYTAFQGSANLANTTFSTTCTNLTPYTLSLDAASGAVSGLNYSLLLNTTSSGGTHPLGPIPGTGSAQTYYINGTMPANQAGSCAGASCVGTNVHTLTVTY
jgi:spore coat protein U-like protein